MADTMDVGMDVRLYGCPRVWGVPKAQRQQRGDSFSVATAAVEFVVKCDDY